MITDPILIERVHRMIASKPRKHVTSADVMAVIQKETGGVPYFEGKEPLFRANLMSASHITGLTEKQILDVVTFKSGSLAGKYYKFRCEPAYWQWAHMLKGSWTPQERFLLSCSFGYGQKMARWYVANLNGADWIPKIHQFNVDLNMQVQYVCGDLDALLVQSKGNRLLAYTRYNEGTRYDRATHKPLEHVSDYGRTVNGFRLEFEKRGI